MAAPSLVRLVLMATSKFSRFPNKDLKDFVLVKIFHTCPSFPGGGKIFYKIGHYFSIFDAYGFFVNAETQRSGKGWVNLQV